MVGMLESAAGGKAVGDAGDADAKGRKDLGEVVCGGLAFDIRAKGENDLGGGMLLDSLEEGLDAKLLGADVVQGGKASTEGMVKTAENAAAFERKDVGRLLDDTNFLTLAGGLEANLTEFVQGEKSAVLAGMDRGGGVGDRLGEVGGAGILVPEKPEGATFRAARAEAGQSAEFPRELVEGSRVIERHGRNIISARRAARPQCG